MQLYAHHARTMVPSGVNPFRLAVPVGMWCCREPRIWNPHPTTHSTGNLGKYGIHAYRKNRQERPSPKLHFSRRNGEIHGRVERVVEMHQKGDEMGNETLFIVGFGLFMLVGVVGFVGAILFTIKNKKMLKQQALEEEAKRNRPKKKSPFLKGVFGKQEGQLFEFFASVPSLDIDYPAAEPIEIDREELQRFVSKVFFTAEDDESFFGITLEERETLQCMYNSADSITLDIPAPEQQGSYTGEISSQEELEKIIKGYVAAVPLSDYLTFEPWT